MNKLITVLRMGDKTARELNKQEINKDEVKFLTGYKILMYSGLVYNHTWISVFMILRNYLLLTPALFHNLLFVVFNYENLTTSSIATNLHFAIMDLYLILTSSALLWNSDKMEILCKIFIDEFKNSKIKLSPRQEKIQRKESRSLYWFIKFTFFFFLCGGLWTNIRRPLFDSELELKVPYDGWFPFKVTTWLEFICVWIFQILITFCATFVNYSQWISYIIHARQLCTQCKIFYVQIKETFEYTEDKESDINREDVLKKKLKEILERHQLLLRCFTVFQDIYSLMLSVIFLSSGIILSTVIYIITDPTASSTVVIEFVGIFLPEMIVIAFFHWHGQEIQNKYLHIQEVIYKVDWFNQPISVQKILLNMLSGAARDYIIRADGLQEYTMKGFSELLQATFSYYNMLKAIR